MGREELAARATEVAARQWPGATVAELRRLPGGVSSLTYAAELSQPDRALRKVVLKVAPLGLEPVRNRDVLRQARILRLLGRQGVPVPEVLFEDAALPPLFAMEHVAGVSYEPRLDVTADPPTAGEVHLRALAAARTLGLMQNLEPERLGVGDEPVTSVQDELGRWARLFETVEDDICPGHRELHARLAAAIPAPTAATLVHGDYRLANMLFDGPDLAAVIDWEIWSVGDPRADLAWLLMHTDPSHYFRRERGARDTEAGSGMPRASVLLDAYRSVRAGHVGDLEWFLAYCHYKTASTIAVLVKRNRRLADPDPLMVVGGESLSAVIRRGHEILDARDSGALEDHLDDDLADGSPRLQ